MAHADKVSRGALASLAAEIGELLDGGELGDAGAKEGVREVARGASERAPASAELVETFAVWTLDARSLAPAARGAAKKSGAKKSGAGGPTLRSLARATGRWHHQLKIGGRATAFARTSGSRLELDRVTLRGLFVSPLAQKIDDAIKWIDEHESEAGGGARDPVVRLLVVPSRHLHAFWLFDEREGTSEVFVFDPPPRPGGVRGGVLLGEREFLESVRRVRPVRGLG